MTFRFWNATIMEHVDAFAIFAKVGELESISGAARALGLPKANVSRAVSRLEASYRVSLVDRTTRKLRLTEAGRLLHGHCVRVVEELQEADAEIAAHRGEPSGILRIGCPGDVGRSLLGPHLRDFLDRYPEIDLRIRVGERLLPAPNSLDVVIHSGWLADSRLKVAKLADIPTILVASRSYADQYGLPRTVDELAGHSVIGNFYLDPASAGDGELPARVPILELERGAERHVVPIWRRFACTDHTMMLELVRQGMAIAPIAVSRAADGLASGELLHVLADYRLRDQATLYALYSERISMAPKLRVFLDFMKEQVELQRRTLPRLSS